MNAPRPDRTRSRRRTRTCLALATAASLAGPARAASPQTPAGEPDFGAHWHDGRSEIDGYRWSVVRYGQSRSGQCVMIYVTEPFSESKRVKVDDPRKEPRDTFDALKLNLIRDFQTGIYDYNTMTSVFVRSDDFEPVKISFSGAEWCGHIYEELVFEGRRVRERLSSYFEGESSDRTLASEAGGIAEDNLFIVLRGLRGEFLRPTEKRTVPFLPGAFQRRLTHRPLAWTTAEIERLEASETAVVPAGTFDTMVYLVRVEGGRLGRFQVEAAYPHRLVSWQWSAAGGAGEPREAEEHGELSGSARLQYWKLQDNGHEAHLEALGLEPLPASGEARGDR